MILTPLHRLRPLALMAVLGLAGPAGAFEVQTGFDLIDSPKTPIEGLHRFYVGKELAPGFTLGQAIYSGATGDAGGAFFWGFGAVKGVPLARQLSLRFEGFVGGGGGAAAVVGDGLMTRAHLGLGYRATDRLSLNLGASWIRIEGADVDDPALSFGLGYRFGDLPGAPVQPGTFDKPKLRSVGLRAGQIAARGTTRSGVDQPDLSLVGAEAAFGIGGGTELVLAADGAAKGAEGYMQVLAGLRQRHDFTRGSVFVEGALGFSGGGDVDTGAGALATLGVGAGVRIAPWADLEFVLGGTRAAGGDFGGATGTLRLVRVFDRGQGSTTGGPQRWAYSAGLSIQDPNASFRRPGATATGRPVMQESSLDLFLTDALYLTGTAQTAMGGDVAGFAIGTLGLGYRMELSPKWALSLEGHLGAAGGGGVNVTGGAIAGLKAEIDYALNDRVSVSAGLGKMRALESGGMAPGVLTLGLKFPFETR